MYSAFDDDDDDDSAYVSYIWYLFFYICQSITVVAPGPWWEPWRTQPDPNRHTQGHIPFLEYSIINGENHVMVTDILVVTVEFRLDGRLLGDWVAGAGAMILHLALLSLNKSQYP